ncbi:MAG: SUMF1/EgtB/PvdO family nonheme iron enzyme [Desulfobacteraceae bacterium]|nr:SUMF1/EgtB/PvdO family nonheme iron enzyme [Desulfobacteraceae bacterium]
MADPKRLYKVFISSTFIDNEERRKLVRDAVTMAGMVWHGMDIFTAETKLSKVACLKYVKEADLLVGIIAWRYGWEPDGEKSITEMEYDAAKERLMFLLDPELPVNPETDFDPGEEIWKKQEKLAAFKKRFSNDQMPALFNESTLQSKVLFALNRWKDRKENPSGDNSREAEETLPHCSGADDEIKKYCQKAEAFHGNLPVAGFVTQLKVPVDIEDIYIPLHATLDLSGFDGDTFFNASHAEQCLEGRNAGHEISLPEAFRQAELRKRKGIVILGDPGSGKTTHLKRVLLYCLRKKPEEIGLPTGMIPVFLSLRDLKNLDAGLEVFIRDQLSSPHLKSSDQFAKRLLARGNLLFLLDGLDEVADLTRREEVKEWIVDALGYYPSCRFVVTCRFAGYGKTVKLNENFLEMHIRPMNADQAERFIHNWYRIVETGLAKAPEQAQGIAREKSASLVSRLKEPDFRARRVFELTRNSLLLTNICLVHRHRGGLPDKRARLYEECIDVLLEHWRAAKQLRIGVSAQTGKRALQPAALWLHRQEGRTKAKAGELAPYIEPALVDLKWTQGPVKDFLRKIRDESGLLTGWDQENYGFMHLGFQEYLAAREIRRKSFEDESVLKELASHFGESWWQEVTLLLLALEEPSRFTPFMREVVKLPAFAKFPELVDACLDDAAEAPLKPFVELLEADIGKADDLPERRQAAIRVLKRLSPESLEEFKENNEKRFLPETRGTIRAVTSQKDQAIIKADRGGYQLIKIPGGKFMMGAPEKEKDRRDYEGPIHRVKVPEFYMGLYPVTNQEYEVFLNDNPNMDEPKYWADRKFNLPTQPVVGVSWKDAKRYAEWAGLRLPTEAEWEYACRAGTTTRFYSGDKDKDLRWAGWYRSNSKLLLHPVGEKEPNGLGLYDMHGNVWEWMEDDWHGNYNGAPENGSAWINRKRGGRRVLRGGCWYGGAGFCRSAFRYGLEPGIRFIDIGFRLSRSVPLGS